MVIGSRGDEIAGLATMADGDVRQEGAGLLAGQEDERMLGGVEGGTEDLGHAGVEFQEAVTFLAGIDDVLDGGEECAGIGGEVSAGLDLEMDAAAGVAGEVLEGFADGLADFVEIGGVLVAHAGDFVTAAEVEGGDCLLYTSRCV